LFGIYWALIGFPRPARPSEAAGRAVTLDLGAGTAGASGPMPSPPSIPKPRPGEVVTLSFILERGGEGSLGLQLTGPDGRLLTPALPIRQVEPSGRSSYSCDAALLAAEGEYELVVTREIATGDRLAARYPFRVEGAADR
jgi:hypothetical protein